MNKEELNEKINQCLNGNPGIEIYFGMQGDDCRKGNFEFAVQGNLKDMFINVLQEKVLNDDIRLANLSMAEDDRSDTIFHYDLESEDDGQIQGCEMLQLVAQSDNGIPNFSFDEDTIAHIESLVIKIGNVDHDLVLFRKIPPINNFGRMARTFMLGRQGDMFVQQSNDIVKISPGAEFVFVDGEFIIVDLKYFEQTTRYHEPIKQSARNQIAIIEAMGFLDNVDFLNEEIVQNVSLARKLSKINENSPTLTMLRNNELTIDDFIAYTRLCPALAGKFCYSADGKISVSTSSHVKYLLKVFNDDYLISELTRISYDSRSKDRIDTNIVV